MAAHVVPAFGVGIVHACAVVTGSVVRHVSAPLRTVCAACPSWRCRCASLAANRALRCGCHVRCAWSVRRARGWAAGCARVPSSSPLSCCGSCSGTACARRAARGSLDTAPTVHHRTLRPCRYGGARPPLRQEWCCRRSSFILFRVVNGHQPVPEVFCLCRQHDQALPALVRFGLALPPCFGCGASAVVALFLVHALPLVSGWVPLRLQCAAQGLPGYCGRPSLWCHSTPFFRSAMYLPQPGHFIRSRMCCSSR